VVGKDAYLRAVCRYIVLNPVRAGLVTHPGHWLWSSYGATAGEAPVPRCLTVDWVLSLGDTSVRAVAERRYRQFVEAGLAETALPLGVRHSSSVVGDGAVPSHWRRFHGSNASPCARPWSRSLRGLPHEVSATHAALTRSATTVTP
jgi:hypothetical protein